MVTIRRAADRMRTHTGWLDSRHTFSFAEHHDPRFTGFGALRAINEDRLAPGGGFGTRSHRDVEILSYVIDGALRCDDSIGTHSIVESAAVHRLSAGTGMLHSEQNASSTASVHLLQIWIRPARTRLRPSSEHRGFPVADRRASLTLLASNDAREGSITIHQDVDVYSAVLDAGDHIGLPLRSGREAWLQIVSGTVRLNTTTVAAGDGAGLVNEAVVELHAAAPAEALLLDLARTRGV
jgi:redox-sensitive bicupin YhaK (pirin superfamily)